MSTASGEATGLRRAARLAGWALVLAAGVVALMLVPPWLLGLVPSQAIRRLIIGSLIGLEVAYVAANGAALLGATVLVGVVSRARRRGRFRPLAARLLLLCLSCLLGAGLAEAGATAWLARTQRGTDQAEEDLAPPDPSADDEVDLVVLGESSAAGFPYESWLSVGQIVAWQLGEVFPGRRFRVERLAHPGDTLEQQHRKLAGLRRRPDALIVYCGHNEFAARDAWSRRVDHYLDERTDRPIGDLGARAGRASSVVRLVRETVEAFRVGVAPPPRSRPMLVDVPSYTPSEYDGRLADFRRRLGSIAAFGARVGAPTVLVIPPANDAGFEPNRSYLPARAPRAVREAFARDVLDARRLEGSDPAGALDRYRALLDRQPGFAEVHYRLARLLERSGDRDGAYRHDVAARDLDGLPLRCPTAFQEAYRAAAARHGGLLVDGQAVFRAIGPHGLLDDSLFHDAVHPSLRGHLALSQAILEALHARRAFGWPEGTPAPVIDPTRCAERFGLGPRAWEAVCARGAMFYAATAPLRYDPCRRLDRHRALVEAARKIHEGRPPEAVGLPDIGVPPPVPAGSWEDLAIDGGAE